MELLIDHMYMKANQQGRINLLFADPNKVKRVIIESMNNENVQNESIMASVFENSTLNSPLPTNNHSQDINVSSAR